jgi:predicted alpha-1,6-mannanase (GH76 family)
VPNHKETSLAALVTCVLCVFCALSAAACSSTPAGDGSPSARPDAAGGGNQDGAGTDAPGGQADGGQRDSSASGSDGTSTAGDAAPGTGADDATAASDASAPVDGGSPGAVFDDALRLRAQAAMIPLAAWYDTPTGLWNKTDWWTSANQLETVIDYSRETGDPTYFDEIDNTFVKNSASNFDRFGYYDDDGWWAMVWIKAYDLSHQQKYLDMAKTIFTRMSGAWDAKCGGGIYWAGTKAGANAFKNKNAIPNELFLQVAASLHLRTPGDAGAGSYLDWAQREWTWFKGTGMITAKNQIVDGLANLTTCAAAGPIFTYNQGVLAGGLVDLAASTGDMTLLDQASAIAHATMTLMADPKGILLEAPCGGDVCVQFKGVFMRNLAHLYRARPLPEFQTYMRHQSDNLWNSNRNAQNQFGYQWQLPFDTATASRQSSALDALIAAVMSSNLNLALTGTATGSTACSATETADRAIDGCSRWDSKWCSTGPGGQTLTVDLGSPRSIVAFRLRHAGAGGESSTLNTRDFEIEISSDGQTWTRSVTVTGNTTDVTTHPIPALTARYARVHVTNPQTAPNATSSLTARIYEFEIFGTGL